MWRGGSATAAALLLVVVLAGARVRALNLGINLSGNAYYGNVAIYYDVFMQVSGNTGPWDAYGYSFPSLLDATGAPVPTPTGTGANTTKAWAGFTMYFPAGNYTLTWTGTGSLSVSAGKILTSTYHLDADGNQLNRAVVWLPGPPANAAPTDNSWIQVVATFPVTDVHLLSPPEFAVPGSVFRSDYLALLRPFSTFRFMDWLNTNGNPTVHWSQRSSAVGSHVGKPQGVPYEDIVDIALATGKAVWVNVPALVTDDYVCRLARFFAFGELGPAANPDASCDPTAPSTPPYASSVLGADNVIYLEYSNEVWNSGFSQWQNILCMANFNSSIGYGCTFNATTSVIAAAALANTSLPWSTNNIYGRGQQLTFVLAKRTIDIFRAVFAGSSTAPQLRTLMNVQAGYYNCYYYAYPFFEQVYGALSNTFDFFAIAPYIGIYSDDQAYSVDSIFYNLTLQLNATSTDTNSVSYWMRTDYAFAQTKNVGLIAYEGGQSLSGSVYLANKIAAQLDPRMFTLTQAYFDLWATLVGSDALFNYYSHAGAASQYGAWGAVTSSFVHGSQKYDALLGLLLQPGDANLDGVVNATDCLIVAAAYNDGAPAATNNASTWTVWWRDGDFNHDGRVNDADIALLNAHVSAGVPSPVCVVSDGAVEPVSPTSASTASPTVPAGRASLASPCTVLALLALILAFMQSI